MMRVETERRNNKGSILLTAMVVTLFTENPGFELEDRAASVVSLITAKIPSHSCFREIKSHH